MQQNLLLLRAADPDANHQAPPVATHVSDSNACFEATLEATLKSELSEPVYAAALQAACAKFDAAAGSDAPKNPEIMKALPAKAADRGQTSPPAAGDHPGAVVYSG
jgi:hypothetical protein